MSFLLSVLCMAAIIPAALAGTAKLFGMFCHTRQESVPLLGACLGGALVLETGLFSRLCGSAGEVIGGASASAVMIFSGRMIALAVMIFCIISLFILLIELPSRWLLHRAGREDAVPWHLFRTLGVVLFLSATLGWWLDLIAGYL